MRLFKLSTLLLILQFCINSTSFSQNITSEVDSIFGLNPYLYNGQHNPNNIPSNIKGHTFFEQKEYQLGSVVLNNRKYSNLLLNYDIYNQDVLLKYRDKHNSIGILKIPTQNLLSFDIGDKSFEVYNKNTIYQSIGSGNIKIYFKWEKIIEFIGNSKDYRTHKFSKPKVKRYLLRNGMLEEYNSKRSFLKNFNETDRKKIKTFMKKNRINVKRSDDNKLLTLITYCNTLIN